MTASEESNAWLAAIVRSSDDAIIGKTLEGIVTAWNPAAERIFGYSEAEMIGQSITRIIPEERAMAYNTVQGDGRSRHPAAESSTTNPLKEVDP